MSEIEVADSALAATDRPGRHRTKARAEVDAAPVRRRWWRAWWDNTLVRADVLSVVIYVGLSMFVLAKLWLHPQTYVLAGNPTDQTQFEYFLEYAARVVVHGDFPFFTDRMNVPDGVNLMANTPTYGVSLLMVPITLLFGHAVAFAVMSTLALVATAAAWYWLFSRHLVSSRLAAFVGGGFAGFAPGMISQAHSHPNLANQALVPLLVWWGLRLRETAHWRRNAVVLALLVVWQAFINEEVLLFTAVGAGIFVAVWSWHRRAEARRYMPQFLRGLGTSAVIAAVLLAYPLYWQFTGPQHYDGLWTGFRVYGTDLAAIPAFSSESPLGNWTDAGVLATHVSEENTFYGWPLVVFIVVLAVVLWRNLVVRSAVIAAGVLGFLSVGSRLRVRGHITDIPGPYAPLAHLPLFDSVITSRLALFAIPVVGLLLAMWVQMALAVPKGSFREVLPSRLVSLGIVVLALLPIAPTPIDAVPRIPTPTFITSGAWRDYVGDDQTVMAVPTTDFNVIAMQWSTDEHLDMRIVGGYFLAPDPKDPDGRTKFGLSPRPTSDLLTKVSETGEVPEIVSDRMRADARDDLRHWRVAVLLLDPRTQKYPDQLKDVTTRLVGVTPTFTGDVWVWDVRSLVD